MLLRASPRRVTLPGNFCDFQKSPAKTSNNNVSCMFTFENVFRCFVFFGAITTVHTTPLERQRVCTLPPAVANATNLPSTDEPRQRHRITQTQGWPKATRAPMRPTRDAAWPAQAPIGTSPVGVPNRELRRPMPRIPPRSGHLIMLRDNKLSGMKIPGPDTWQNN